MAKINSLDLNYSNLKDQLDNMSNKINQTLEQSGQELKESGVLDKILNKILDVCRSIKNRFVSHFGEGQVTINGVTYDKNGNMVNQPKTDEGENQQIDEQKGTDNQGKDSQGSNQSEDINDNLSTKSDANQQNEKLTGDKGSSNKAESTGVNQKQNNKTNEQKNSNGSAKVNSSDDESSNNNSESNSSQGGSSKDDSNSKNKGGTITLQDGTVVPKYNDKGEPYNPVTGGYGDIK